jgi:hypothetical protein
MDTALSNRRVSCVSELLLVFFRRLGIEKPRFLGGSRAQQMTKGDFQAVDCFTRAESAQGDKHRVRWN